MKDDQQSRVKQKVFGETKKLFWTTLYLWILLSLFAIHKSLVLKEHDIFFHQGFALINALALAKVILVADMFNLSGKAPRWPLAYRVVLESAMFSIILIGFHFVEESLLGLLRGKTLAESIPSVAGGNFQQILALGAILFVCLMPFFALKEVAATVGSEKLFKLFFGHEESLS